MKLALLLVLLFVCACRAPAPPTPPSKPVMTGVVTRAELDAIPGWSSTDPALDAQIDVEAARGLAAAPAARVQIILGTWCSDSKREVPRLLRALDLGGEGRAWSLDMIGVDRDKKSPGHTLDVAYVPTFIVTRDGKELGRIVESAPNGIERDLLSLLTGAKSGVLSGRTDLAP